MEKEKSLEIEVVKRMLQAFGSGNMEEFKKALSEDTVWNYNGTDNIPYSGTYKGKEEAVSIISSRMLKFLILRCVRLSLPGIPLLYSVQKSKKSGRMEKCWSRIGYKSIQWKMD